VEWATVVGAFAGGTIGLAGDLIGRLGARRQAVRQRQEALEDAERSRRENLQDEQTRETSRRARAAAEGILRAFVENRVSLLDPVGMELPTEDLVERAMGIWGTVYVEKVHIPDAELRRRLGTCEAILDLATTPGLGLGMSLRDVVFTVRQFCYESLGAWLRDEALPAPTTDWTMLVAKLEVTKADWLERLERAGRAPHPYHP
jgi:hypothetical protein